MSDVRVCVDASIIANVFFVQPLSAKATALVQQRATDNAQMVAPDLLVYEVLNAAHQYRRRGLLSHALEQQVIKLLRNYPIKLVRTRAIHERAFSLAAELSTPGCYDAHYLAVAELHHAPFRTADERLYNTVHSRLPWVHSLDEV